jgi:hypothetical protein
MKRVTAGAIKSEWEHCGVVAAGRYEVSIPTRRDSVGSVVRITVELATLSLRRYWTRQITRSVSILARSMYVTQRVWPRINQHVAVSAFLRARLLALRVVATRSLSIGNRQSAIGNRQ